MTDQEWTFATENAELTISREGDQLTITVGVPTGWMAEEPDHSIELSPAAAGQVADRLTMMRSDALRARKRPGGIP